jgi:hypothetical protein
MTRKHLPIRKSLSLLVAAAAWVSLAGCAAVSERMEKSALPLAEFGSLPGGTPRGYVEFVHAPTSSIALTTAAWSRYDSEWETRPEGSYGQFRTVRDPVTGNVVANRVRLLAPVGQQKFELLVNIGLKPVGHTVMVPVQADKVTPVQVEWKILGSFLGMTRYSHKFEVGEPVPYTPVPTP